MRTAVVLLLVFSVMLITFSKSIIALQHEVNEKFIAAVLCENRNKPKSHCNGSCHLKKTMKNDEQKENAPGNSIKGGLEIQLFSFSNGDLFFDRQVIKNMDGVYTVSAFIEPCFSVFHPPKSAC